MTRQCSSDSARALRLYGTYLLWRALCFGFGLGLLLAGGAMLLGLWWLGIPLAVCSLLGYAVGTAVITRR